MKKSWKKPDEKPAQPGKDLEPRLDPVNQVAGQGTTAAARRDAHQVVVSQQNFSGPLPPPELLRQYQEIMTNLPEIIVQRMMDEMTHRQDMERRHLAMCEGWLQVTCNSSAAANSSALSLASSELPEVWEWRPS